VSSTILNSRHKFEGLQVLRGLAATMIVVGHVFSQNLGFSAQPFIWIFSRIYVSGADIFFSICGFIILYSVRNEKFNFRNSLIFLIRRLLRIYPVYWFVFILSIYISNYVALNLDNQNFHSYFDLFFLTKTDNFYNPPGWSLPFEIYFYIGVFIITIFFKTKFEIIVPVWLIIQSIIAIKYTSYEVTTHALLSEFLFGVLVYYAYKNNINVTNFDFILFFILSLVFFFIGFKLAKNGPLSGWQRVLTYGIGGMFITYACILIDKFKITFPKILILIGDASYSIYISHHLFMRTIFFICDVNQLWNLFPSKYHFIGVSLITLLSILFGILIHFIIEIPVLSFSKKIYLKFKTL